MKPVSLPSVAIDTGFAPTRDYRRVASIPRPYDAREQHGRNRMEDLVPSGKAVVVDGPIFAGSTRISRRKEERAEAKKLRKDNAALRMEVAILRAQQSKGGE